MLEYNIIKLIIKDKKEFLKYGHHLKNLALEQEVRDILTTVERYYDKYPDHEYISQDELKNFVAYEFPSGKKKEALNLVLSNVFAMDTSDSLGGDILKALIEKDTANKIVQELIPVISDESKDSIPKVKELLEAYDEAVQLKTLDEDLFVDDGLEELLEATATDGLSWSLDCLNDNLGPLPGGTLGHIFARPETGKTSFLHSTVAHMVRQVDGPILWVNNEEDKKRVKLRFYSAVCQAPLFQIAQSPQEYAEIFREQGGDKMKLLDRAIISVSEIERICKELHPRLVVIDQGDKVATRKDGKAGNTAERLKMVYDDLREVVKRCNEDWKMDIITIGQADAAAEGHKWLFQSNLDSGKTGKAGAFDYIVGIGKELNDSPVRYISFCKNKLLGGVERHAVNLDKSTGLYSN